MSKRPTIREQIDACRPDSDDPHLPEHAAELAELAAGLRESDEIRSQWERSQHNDRILRGAMQDVSLPTGLEARLLAAVQAAGATSLSGVEQAAEQESPAGENLVSPARSGANRRSFLQVAGVFATTAALALIGFLVIQSSQPTEQTITKDRLVSQVQEWLQKMEATPMTKPSKAIPTPGGVFGTVVEGTSFSSSQGTVTAYSVTLRGSNAKLLVIPTSRQWPVGAMPYTKVSGVSGGWIVGAWQKEGVLYVIAVDERAGGDLNQFTPPPPVG